MSDEHDSWFKDAFGVDLGQTLSAIPTAAAGVLDQAADAAGAVLQGVQGAVGAVVGAAAAAVGAAGGAVKKAVASATGSGDGAGSGGGTDSFPLGGSVGRGGKNAPNDVRAVQRALGINDDGQCGGQTIGAIEAFQRKMGMARPDGRVDAGGATERAMAGGAARPPTAAQGDDLRDLPGEPVDEPADDAADNDDTARLIEQVSSGAVSVIDVPGLGKFDLNAAMSQAANQVVAANVQRLPFIVRAEELIQEARNIVEADRDPSGSLQLPPVSIPFSGKCCSVEELQRFRSTLETTRVALQNSLNAYNDSQRAIEDAAEQGQRACIGSLALCMLGSAAKPGAGGAAACLAGAVACIASSAPVENAIRVQIKAKADLEVANGVVERALANHKNCFEQRCASVPTIKRPTAKKKKR